MNALLASLLLVGCISASQAADCSWTGCEGVAILGQVICNKYYKGVYTGRTQKGDCSWDTSKVECCKPSAGGECKLTPKCYGTAYGGNYACSSDFGKDWIPNGESDTTGCGWSLKKHKCCN